MSRIGIGIGIAKIQKLPNPTNLCCFAVGMWRIEQSSLMIRGHQVLSY